VLIVLNIICNGEVLFWLCLFGILRLPVLDRHIVLEIWDIFCYYFVEYIKACSSSPSLMANELQVWSFDVVSEFLHIPLSAFESFI
jgi:hypothetical protein